MKAPHIAFEDENEIVDAIIEAVDVSDNDYETGMENMAIAFLYRQKAKERRCAFIDPHYVRGNHALLFQELRRQPTETIFTAPINVYADNTDAPNNAYRQLFKNTVSLLQESNYFPDTVIIPIGCQETGTVPHNILVVLENFSSCNAKASIIDQMGADYYIDTKIKINDTLKELGISHTETNEHPIMSQNRNDCATFTSFMADYAVERHHNDMHEFIALSDARRGCIVSADMVDAQHRKDREHLVKAVNDFSAELRQERNIESESAGSPERKAPTRQAKTNLRNFVNSGGRK